MTIKLRGARYKECPFCGSEAIYRSHSTIYATMRCAVCKAKGPAGNTHEVEEKWNARVYDGSLKHEANPPAPQVPAQAQSAAEDQR